MTPDQQTIEAVRRSLKTCVSRSPNQSSWRNNSAEELIAALSEQGYEIAEKQRYRSIRVDLLTRYIVALQSDNRRLKDLLLQVKRMAENNKQRLLAAFIVVQLDPPARKRQAHDAEG